MANQQQITLFDKALKNITAIDLAKSLRKSLGEASLYDRFSRPIQEIISRLSTVDSVKQTLSNSALGNITGVVNALNNHLVAMGNQPVTDFVANTPTHVGQLDSFIDNFSNQFTPALVYAQEEFIRKGLSGEQGASVEAARGYLDKHAAEILADVRKQAEEILSQARQKATDIHTQARDTASGVSLIKAQEMFGGLLEQFKKGMKWSGIAAAIGLVIFIVIIIILLWHTPDISNPSEAIFYTAIRLALLGAAAALVAFAAKIFRSNLHMYYHALHRQQLTNSIRTFVDAARTDEQRDTIFAKLVEAVSAFGSSGLIASADDLPNAPKILIEALPRLLGHRTE